VNRTDIDRAGLEPKELADDYARKAAALAADPYFREAIVKVSVSGFVWSLYQAFDDDFARTALDSELRVQSAAIGRAVAQREAKTH